MPLQDLYFEDYLCNHIMIIVHKFLDIFYELNYTFLCAGYLERGVITKNPPQGSRTKFLLTFPSQANELQ